MDARARCHDLTVYDLLDRPTYTFPTTDSLLHLRPGTARRWIDGYIRGGRQYEPVVRETSTGVPTVTWGEFVETRLLAEYRDKGVPMIRMRPAVDVLRRETGFKYPLAHLRPLTHDRDLVLRVQDEAGLDRALRLVVVTTGQLLLSDEVGRFVETVELEDDDVVVRLRPGGADTPVCLDPLVRSGAPVIRSTPTDVLAELYRAGDSIAKLSDWYELSKQDVRAALRYECVDIAS